MFLIENKGHRTGKLQNQTEERKHLNQNVE
jgi:hypothetical protein